MSTASSRDLPCPEWDMPGWLSRGSYDGQVVEPQTGWAGGVRMLRVEQPAGQFQAPPTTDLCIQLVDGPGLEAAIDLGAGRFEVHSRTGHILVAPALTPTTYRVAGPLAARVFCLDWLALIPTIREASNAAMTDLGPLHDQLLWSAETRHFLNLLWAHRTTDSPASRLYAEGLTQALVAALVMAASPARAERTSTGLPPWRLRTALFLLGDRLEADVSLMEVAEAVGLSPYHFCRAFRSSTGITPHAWRNARRIEQAKQLMHRADAKIVDVALSCGFAHQAHFTTAFRKATGVTPARYRRERLG